MCLLAQPGQPARQRLKSQQYNRNIEKRGQVPKSKQPKKEGYTVGPVLLAFFLFIVVGSGMFPHLGVLPVCAVHSRCSFCVRSCLANHPHCPDWRLVNGSDQVMGVFAPLRAFSQNRSLRGLNIACLK